MIEWKKESYWKGFSEWESGLKLFKLKWVETYKRYSKVTYGGGLKKEEKEA